MKYVILILAALVLTVPTLNLAGVCINKNGKQPLRTDDTAIIDAAIDEVLAGQYISGQQYVVESKESGGKIWDLWVQRYIYHDENLSLYTDSVEFKRINPDCCSITQKGKKRFTPSFYQRISGQSAKFVRIEYRGMDRLPDGTRKPFRNIWFFAVSNCGRLWSGI